VVARRGLLRATTVKLSFAAAIDWSRERISFDCSSDEAFGRQMPPVAAPARTLSARSLAAPGARLAGALVERGKRQVTHLLIARGVAWAQERKAAVGEVSFEDGRLRLAVQIERLPIYRDDGDLLLLAREALARQPHLTADDRRGLTVEAADGVVRLGGNVRTEQAKHWAEQAAASVDGAASVRNEIRDDIGLEMAVAQALDRAGLFRTATVYARSSLGEVTLFGYAPSAAMVAEIVRIASQTPGVRSMANRLEARVPTSPAATTAPAPAQDAG